MVRVRPEAKRPEPELLLGRGSRACGPVREGKMDKLIDGETEAPEGGCDLYQHTESEWRVPNNHPRLLPSRPPSCQPQQSLIPRWGPLNSRGWGQSHRRSVSCLGPGLTWIERCKEVWGPSRWRPKALSSWRRVRGGAGGSQDFSVLSLSGLASC